jgi:murein DD-endopeptidase MepM/ murein hydrolase activator NlpD
MIIKGPLELRKRFFALVLLVFFAFFPAFSEETIHVLQKGETIYSIARLYGISAQAVLSLNGMTEADATTIQAGKRLRIPTSSTQQSGTVPASQSGATKNPYGEYRITKGDTLYSIARRYSISLAELLDMNGFSPSYVIKEGERIRVPAKDTNTVTAGTSTGTTPATGTSTGAASGTSTGANTGAASGTAGKTPVDTSIRWPVQAKEVSYLSGKLSGVMITGTRSEQVKSLARGTVVSAGPYRGFGRVAIVEAAGGYLYVYGGFESLSVKEGDKVGPGAELGKLGIDAKTEKPQLFFLVYRNNSPIDPAKAPRA